MAREYLPGRETDVDGTSAGAQGEDFGIDTNWAVVECVVGCVVDITDSDRTSGVYTCLGSDSKGFASVS